jgi:hypothetical protein
MGGGNENWAAIQLSLALFGGERRIEQSTNFLLLYLEVNGKLDDSLSHCLKVKGELGDHFISLTTFGGEGIIERSFNSL